MVDGFSRSRAVQMERDSTAPARVSLAVDTTHGAGITYSYSPLYVDVLCSLVYRFMPWIN
eukprot:scaffold3453_cov256-Chaetoceros_neogracile.AAC.16